MQQFMQLAQQDIEQQENALLEPLKQQISEAIHQVGIEQNFTVIYDLANPELLLSILLQWMPIRW